jgi:hypothetical protein
MHRYKKLLICKARVATRTRCSGLDNSNVNTAGVTIVASGDAKEAMVKQFIVGTLATVLTGGALIAAAPPASAGCQYGGGLVEKMCDGPIQDVIDRRTCQMMGPGQNPLGLAYGNPPTHIDD